jgi:GDPmannose 4,6-dehydratase
MHRMLRADEPNDYIIGSGNMISLREFVYLAFAEAGLNVNNHIIIDNSLIRPADPKYSGLDASRIESELGWKAKIKPSDLIRRMFNDQLI